ncbi:PQ-loop domain-containing transporter [Mycoplasmopsis felis]|uniref:PQ-loop domain-containing transporter n=3 Tax=Mycoplasmopsis felis TaxID=33923 RepID=UPI002AFFACDA|nr:PQ-loop domain-containing transporter [Mycoplasmopsis felis]WQQ08722.1 PQ-loop domain-containing transporter [Mycoplasmopsis felis]
MEHFIVIVSWIVACLVASLGIPQLISLLKSKRTGKINFISFWIFHLGILLWVIWSSLGSDYLLSTFVANSVCLTINSITLYFLYHYKREFNKNQKLAGLIGILFVYFIGIIFFVLKFTISYRWQSDVQTTMSLIFPSFTTLAFLPQLIYSLRKKIWKGISIWMYVLYEVNNLFWILYWILNLVHLGVEGALIGALIWQTISFTLFGIQFYFTLIDLLKTKKEMKKISY